jgi:hypothetical protein
MQTAINVVFIALGLLLIAYVSHAFYRGYIKRGSRDTPSPFVGPDLRQ